MTISKWLRIGSIVFYLIGIAIFVALAGFALFGENLVPFPDAMVPWSMRDYAFVGLAIGSIPMLLACMALYKFNNIKSKKHKKILFPIIFLPCFICTACALFLIGFIIYLVVKTMIEHPPMAG